MMTFCIIAFLVLLVYFFINRFFLILNVVGNSMKPTLFDGDILVAIRVFSVRTLKEGNIIVAKPTDCDDRLVIKRISAMMKLRYSYVYVLGDNPEESYDSRDYGWLSEKRIVAKVLWKKLS